jgi:spoIIIJ-associated protein
MAKTTLEYIAPSSEEAIIKGLAELGISRDKVEIEILDSGSKGLFGLGGRQARVRLTVIEELVEDFQDKQDGANQPDPLIKHSDVSVPYTPAELTESEDTSAELINADTLKVAINVVEELLEKMRIQASVIGKIGKPADESDQETIMIDIKGDDLSYLIGRHSETLNALQYITSLIVGRELGHWIPLMIDVQGYRERRERQLRQMASRMADQVMKSGRRISLEPMPGTERRIIHLALRDYKNVYTESVGEEPNRKVVILPKN